MNAIAQMPSTLSPNPAAARVSTPLARPASSLVRVAAADTVSITNPLEAAFAKLDGVVKTTNDSLRDSRNDTAANHKKFHADIKNAQDQLLAAWSKQGIPENKAKAYYSVLDRYAALTEDLQKRYDRDVFKVAGISFTDLKKDFSIKAIKYSSDSVTKLRLATFNLEYRKTSDDEPIEKEVVSFWAKNPGTLAASEKTRVIVSLKSLLDDKKISAEDQESFISGLYPYFADLVGSYRKYNAETGLNSKRGAQLYLRELRENMESVLPKITGHYSDMVQNLDTMGIKATVNHILNKNTGVTLPRFTGEISIEPKPTKNWVAIALKSTVSDWSSKAFPTK